MIRPNCTAALGSVALAACGSLSGLDGHSQYACQAPEGVACQSVSGTYANTVAGTSTRPALGKPVPGNAPLRSSAAPTVSMPPVATIAATDGTRPLRSTPRVLRLWFKPWEDADHDLYDQGFVYVQVDTGRWQIDHAPRATRDTSLPLRPPVARAANVEARPVTSPPPAGRLGAPGSAPRAEDGNE